MTNIKKCENYNISLDLGIGSVGWSVQDGEGNLLKYKGRRTWGSRLFKPADDAQNRRFNRGSRRKYIRRRQRIEALQSIFEDEIMKIDPEFFNKLKYSKLHIEDKREYVDGQTKVLFKEYYKYKTIYHLRLHLLGFDVEYDDKGNYKLNENGEIKLIPVNPLKEDIRLIYLALHHIAKHRGNYLYDSFTFGGIDNTEECVEDLVNKAVENLQDALDNYQDFYNSEGSGTNCDLAISNRSMLVSLIMDKWQDESSFKKDSYSGRISDKPKLDEYTKLAFGFDSGVMKGFYKSVIGYSFDWKKLTPNLDKDIKSIRINDDNEYENLLEIAPDEIYDLLLATKECNRLYELNKLLGGNRSLSEAFVRRHAQHYKDIKLLKDAYKKYLGTESPEYKFMFGRNSYDGFDEKSKKGSYRDYVKSSYGQCTYDDLIKAIYNKSNKGGGDLYPFREEFIEDENGRVLLNKLENTNASNFLKKLRVSDNVLFPYQLNEAEAKTIIERYSEFYPDILGGERCDEILNIIFAKIPYYVGPLYNNGKSRNVWNLSIDDENVSCANYAGIRPWNWEKYINKEKTAERFITRMTGKCSYLYGEDVLPANSLLYQEYKVRQEINGIKIDGRRIDQDTAELIYNEIFKKQVSVTGQRVLKFLRTKNYPDAQVISGFQGKESFANNLSTYHFFKRIFLDGMADFDLLDFEKLSFDDMEEIVKLNTIFEDRDVFRSVLEEKFGENRADGKEPLNESEIKKLVNKRFKGWGNLSKRFLTGVSFGNGFEHNSIIKMLREGDPTNHHAITLLEQIKFNKELIFWEVVDRENSTYLEESRFNVDELYTSPKWKRSLKQTEKVVDEIIRIANTERDKDSWVYPQNIFIEVTRDDEYSNKNQFSKSRAEFIEKLIKDIQNLNNDNQPFLNSGLVKEDGRGDNKKYKLGDEIKKKINDDMIYLYLQQGCRCMYSGDPIDFNRLSETCDIDHIVPKSLGGVDSLVSNRVLVLKTENQSKGNNYPVSKEKQEKMKSYWKYLRDKGAISQIKYKSLTRVTDLAPEEIGKFTEKQLTETSQIVKYAQVMLEDRFRRVGADVSFRTVRASFISSIRDVCGFPKIRDLNNFHHAHDAYLLGRAGLFINDQFFNRSEGDKVNAYRMFLNRWKKGNRKSYDGFLITKFNEMVWDNSFELDSKIEKDLYSCDVFTSHMVGDNSSDFWNETIRSPKLKNKNLKNVLSGRNIPRRVKDNTGRLPGNKYGGNEKVNYAYKACVLVDTSNGKVVELVNIPVWVDRSNNNNSSLLEEYIANNLKTTHVCSFEIKRKIFCDKNFGTDININGCPFIIGGNSKKTNTLRGNYNLVPVIEEELYFALGQCKSNLEIILNRLSNSNCEKSTLRRITSIIIKEAERVTKDQNYHSTILTDIILESLYDVVCQQLIEKDWRIGDEYLKDHHEMFVNLSLQDKCVMLFRLLNYFNNDKLQVGLLETGRTLDGKEKSKEKYEFKRNIIDLIVDNDFSFIDKSVTGMKETRICVGEWLK